jgi:hypothetical protein
MKAERQFDAKRHRRRARLKRGDEALQTSRGYRAGSTIGGIALAPAARAGSPSMKQLQPLLPDTRN